MIVIKENINTRGQTGTSVGTALFWAITQRVVVISYRRFGTTYGVLSSRVQNPIVPKSRQEVTTTRYVMVQKSVDLIYFAAEA